MKFTTSFLLFFTTLTCLAQEPQILRIDPYYASGGTVQQILAEINYTPLETTDESLFGKIDKLFITDQYYIIQDQSTNAILFFFKDGRYHTKIKGGKMASDYSNALYSMYLIKEKQEVWVQKRNKTEVYNFDGKLVREEKGMMMQYRFTNDREVSVDFYPNAKYGKDTVQHQLTFKEKGKVYKELLPYNKKKHPLATDEYYITTVSPLIRAGSDTTATYWRPYDYTIHQVSPTGMTAPYRFVFPMTNSLPTDFSTDSSYNGNRLKYLKDNKAVIYSVSHFYQMSNNIFFKTNKYDSSDDAYMYNLKSGRLISLQKISPDSSNYFLPVIDEGYEFTNSNFHIRDDNYLYTSISSMAMFIARDKTTDKKPDYPPHLKKYFSTRNRKDNPVIIQLKPKDQL